MSGPRVTPNRFAHLIPQQPPPVAAESTAVAPPRPNRFLAAQQAAPSANRNGHGTAGFLGAQGLLAGFADEVLPVAGAVASRIGERLLPGEQGTEELTFGELVSNMRDDARAQQAAYEAANPKTAMAAEVLGAVAPAVATGGAALLPRVAGGGARAALTRAAATTTAQGAAAGAVAGAGNTPGGIRERAVGAVFGAVPGAVLGTAARPLGNVVRGGAKLLDNLIAEGRVTNPAAKAGRADRLVAEALERDGTDPAQLARITTRKPAMVADVAGENTRDLLDAAATVPSAGKDRIHQAIGQRNEGQARRVLADLERSVGLDARDAVDVAEEIVQRRAAQARPLYEAAYAKGAVDLKPVEKALHDIPTFRAAFARGQKIAKLEGVELPKARRVVRDPKTGRMMRVEVDVPNVQALDYMKQGLDDIIAGRMRSGKMGRKEARLLRQKLDEVLAEVDAVVPEYARARAAYAGESKLLDAVQTGRKILREDVRVSRKAVERMSEGEREMFRLGGIDAIRERVRESADGRDVVKVLFGTEDKRRTVRTLFPQGAEGTRQFDRFRRAMEQEAQMYATGAKVTGNSRTIARGQAVADLAGVNIGEALGTAGDVVTGNVPGLARRLTDAAGRKVAGGLARVRTRNAADEIAERLTLTPGTPEYKQFMDALARFALDRAARQQQSTVTARAFGVGGGSTTGTP